MLAAFKSSGDLIADRRFQYGQALFREGDFVAAAELFEQAIECAPHWPAAHWSLGKARRESGDRPGAAAAFRDCLRLDPADMLGASLALAELDAAVTIDAAPGAYVKALFDAYAADFDKALVERLDYTTPQRLAAMVRAARKVEGRSGRALDLGCGTGLAGEAIVADFAWLEGVDLSDGMIEAARLKGVYNRLETTDILQALHSRAENFELILAADVLIYFGDLRKTIAAISRRLASGGLFAFSVEKADGADWTLQSSLRFAHSADYVVSVLKTAGLDLVSMEEAVLRKDRGAEVAGLLVVSRLPKSRSQNLPSTGDASFIDAPASVH
jgi:predicted TPR repeat methyltransferase